MKKQTTLNKRMLLFGSFAVVILLIGSCRKEIAGTFEKPVSQELLWAKNYYEEKLQPNEQQLLQPIKIMANGSAAGKNKTNKISIRWDAGYAAKTLLYDFVEVPVNIDGKIMPTFFVTKDPTAKPVMDLKVINASLNRLVIYKDDKGKTNQRLLTYVPDRDYLDKHHADISHNRINKLDKDFFGYIQYKDWDGKVLFMLRIEDGKSIRKIEASSAITLAQAAKLSQSQSSGSSGKVMKYDVIKCDDYIMKYMWEQWCYYEGNSQTPNYCDPPEAYDIHIYPNCPGGGVGTPVPAIDCTDPQNFDNAKCLDKMEIKTDQLALTYPCMVKLILKKLQENANFKKMTDPFRKPLMPNGTPINIPGLPNLTYTFSSQDYGTPAPDGTFKYQLGETGYSQGNWDSVVQFNSEAIEKSSRLFLQAAAIHETGHAYAHFYLKAGSYEYDMGTPMYKTWAMKIVDYAAVLKGEKNEGTSFTDHSIFLENYYDTMWGILKDINGNAYTDKEYQMAMLYGMNNPGAPPLGTGVMTDVYNIYKARMQKSYDNLKKKYGLKETEIDTFNKANLKNVPQSNKLPSSC